MSGHSKWSTIKRKKGAEDAKRGKIFTRCIHEITTAVKEGGGPDPSGNPRLRLAIDKAKAVNMPSTNIEKAIKRASGGSGGEERVELTYEGYGPGGVAIMVQVLTDNKNRSVSEIRHGFTRHGGSLGENGCVSYMFSKKGLFLVKKEGTEEESLMEVALEIGADDVAEENESWEIICKPEVFHELDLKLREKLPIQDSELAMIPNSQVSLDKETFEKVTKMIDYLDDLPDVINVYSNAGRR